jgi:ribonuclease HI
LQATVNTHISRHPPGTLVVFTDGSAAPNPGPAGAGAIFFNSSSLTSHPNCPLAAALGITTNNAGELFAVGLSVETANTAGYTGPLRIYTDSKLIQNAINNNTSAGIDNTDLLVRVKRTITIFKRADPANSVRLHWVEAHRGITQNELADKLAGTGSKRSAARNYNNQRLSNFIDSNYDFRSLTNVRGAPTLTALLRQSVT